MKPPRVFVYDTINSRVHQRGISRYFDHLISGLVDYFGPNLFVYSPNQRDYGAAKHVRGLALQPFRGSSRLGMSSLMRWINDRNVESLLKTTRFDVIYTSYYGTLLARIPQVYAVYDMIHELFPNYFSKRQRSNRDFIREKYRCMRHATSLFAISQSVSSDIRQVYPNIPADKISITHLGVDQSFFKKSEDIGIFESRPYFLFVGHRFGYKNFSRLITAFGLSNLAATHDLLVVSPIDKEFHPAERMAIRHAGIEHAVKLIPAPTENALRDAYAKSVALVYPSEYEGFGLPILEAMASGTLVVTSNTSSMLEIGNEMAVYFSPTNVEHMASKLVETANFPSEHRQALVEGGIKYASKYTWQACQNKTIELLLLAAGQK